MKYINNNYLISSFELTKSFNISRKELIEYEEKGLIEVSYKDPITSYRYYEPTIFIKLNKINELKNSGLSIKEIKDYFLNELINKEELINNLKKRRDDIDSTLFSINNINRLYKKEINEIIYYYEEKVIKDINELPSLLNNIYLNALKKDYILSNNSPFIIFNKDKLNKIEDSFKIKICIPLIKSYEEKNINVLSSSFSLIYEVNNISFNESLNKLNEIKKNNNVKIKNEIIYLLDLKDNELLNNHKFIIIL